MIKDEYIDHELRIIMLEHLAQTLARIESTQKWMLGLMDTGFIGLLSLMSHGFKWLNY